MSKRKKWSKEKVIDAILERERHGLPLSCVRKDDQSLESAAHRWFGGWTNALLAAGLKPHVRKTWNKETVVAAIHDRHQRGLPLRNVNKHDKCLLNAACCYFGSWSNAMSAAGLEELVRKRRNWTKQDVIDGILERKQRGLPIINVAKHNYQLATAALKFFGSWHNAVSAAGLDPHAHRKWSKEKVLKQILLLRSKGVPMSDIYKHDPGLRPAGRRYFRRWSAALRAAGFDCPHKPYRRWSKQLVIETILDRHRQGLPLRSMGNEDTSLADAGKKYFGSWHNALQAAGIEAKQRRSWNNEIVIKEIQSRQQAGLPVRNLYKHDPALASAAMKYFGSWTNAYLAAGIEPLAKKWSKQRILDEIKAWHSKGLPFSKIERDYSALAGAAYRYYGGLGKALRAAGFESKPLEKWSQQRIISEVQALHKGGSLKHAKGAQYHALVSASRRHFGSWNNALVAAGFAPIHHGVWSKDRIVQEIQKLHVRGMSLKVASAQNSKLVNAAFRYYGSWANALKAAGVPHQVFMPNRKRKWSAQRVIAEIHARYEKGLPMNDIRGSDPRLLGAANKLFRSWKGAMEAAGFCPRQRTWNKRSIVAEIRIRHCSKMGTSKVGTDDMNLYNAAKEHFGGWSNALRAAGITPDIGKPNSRQLWSRQRVIDEIQVRHQEGLYLTATWPANRFLHRAARQYFGSWRNALRAAGTSPEEMKRTWQKKSEKE